MNLDLHQRRLVKLRRLGFWSLIFWPAFLIAGYMAFSAPLTGQSLWPYVALLLALAYGALPFAASAVAMKALSSGLIKTAYVVGALPISILPLLAIYDLVLIAWNAWRH